MTLVQHVVDIGTHLSFETNTCSPTCTAQGSTLTLPAVCAAAAPCAHLSDELIEGVTHTQPAGQDEARLCPGKDPWYGAQVGHRRPGLASGWPAADVEVAQLGLWGGCSEVTDEVGVLEHNRPAQHETRQSQQETHTSFAAHGQSALPSTC
jgi:hypothetical protein